MEVLHYNGISGSWLQAVYVCVCVCGIWFSPVADQLSRINSENEKLCAFNKLKRQQVASETPGGRAHESLISIFSNGRNKMQSEK